MQPTIFVDGLNRLLLIVKVTHEDMAATETDFSLTKPTQSMHDSVRITRLAVKTYRVGQADVQFSYYILHGNSYSHVSDSAYIRISH